MVVGQLLGQNYAAESTMDLALDSDFQDEPQSVSIALMS